jgi:GNAT superfamily N-acetyltransferase
VGSNPTPGTLLNVLGVTLRDGSSILIRPVEPDDKAAIVSGFEKLSPESRYRRFFSPLVRLSDRDLAYLTEVDHHDHEALIGFSESREPLGVARFVRLSDPHKAEVAVVVIDEWQGRGVATALLTQLVDRARHEGVQVFTATILTDNRDALGLMRSMGDAYRVGAPSTTTELEIELPPLGMGERLRDALRHAAAGVLSGREPSHPRTRLRRGASR